MSDQSSSSPNDATIGVLFALVSAIAFSAKAVFIKLAYAYPVDAVTLMTLRMLIATPFFVAMAVMGSRDKQNAALGLRDWGVIAGLGLIGMYLSQLFDFMGLQYVSAGMERTILFLYPTFVVLISAALNGKGVGRREIVALVLCYAGIILVAVHELSFDGNSGTLLGAGLVFLSTLTYASYLVGSSSAIHRFGMQRFTGYTMSVSCVAVLGHFTLTHPVDTLRLPMKVYELGVLMALVSTVLPVVLLNAGIKRLGGSRASLISSVGPVSTVLLAAMFLNEAITLRQVAGTALVLAGVIAITLPEGKKD